MRAMYPSLYFTTAIPTEYDNISGTDIRYVKVITRLNAPERVC